MKVEPTCRYGHGNLSRIERTPENHYWGFMGSTLVQMRTGVPFGLPLNSAEFSGRVYTVELYRCPECGYMEAFDDEVVNG